MELIGSRVCGCGWNGQLRKFPTYGGCRKASCGVLFARGGRLLSPPLTSRKIDGLVFLLPAPSCSFVILGFVRASPSSRRHRIRRVMICKRDNGNTISTLVKWVLANSASQERTTGHIVKGPPTQNSLFIIFVYKISCLLFPRLAKHMNWILVANYDTYGLCPGFQFLMRNAY